VPFLISGAPRSDGARRGRLRIVPRGVRRARNAPRFRRAPPPAPFYIWRERAAHSTMFGAFRACHGRLGALTTPCCASTPLAPLFQLGERAALSITWRAASRGSVWASRGSPKWRRQTAGLHFARTTQFSPTACRLWGAIDRGAGGARCAGPFFRRIQRRLQRQSLDHGGDLRAVSAAAQARNHLIDRHRFLYNQFGDPGALRHSPRRRPRGPMAGAAPAGGALYVADVDRLFASAGQIDASARHSWATGAP
jgi:hypothetical protein